jgi:uridine kinase
VGIIDGVVALDIKGLRDLSDFTIYVETDDVVRKKRLKEFYREDKKCSVIETEQIIKSREIDEVGIIRETKKYADIIYRDES